MLQTGESSQEHLQLLTFLYVPFSFDREVIFISVLFDAFDKVKKFSAPLISSYWVKIVGKKRQKVGLKQQ